MDPKHKTLPDFYALQTKIHNYDDIDSTVLNFCRLKARSQQQRKILYEILRFLEIYRFIKGLMHRVLQCIHGANALKDLRFYKDLYNRVQDLWLVVGPSVKRQVVN